MTPTARARTGWVLAVGVVLAGVLFAGAVPAGAADPPPTRAAGAVTAAVAAAAKPEIRWDPIPYGPVRRAQMAGYAERHYGRSSARLTHPRQIVLHFTVTAGYRPVWNHFAANTAARGTNGGPEKPGTCAHFVVDTDGTIHQLVSLRWMCRHTVGLNDQSIGIEFVELRSAANVLKRSVQVGAGLRLVRWLQASYGIADRDVIGHSMANRSRFFTELRGWRNTHVDWGTAQVRAFRARL